MHEALSPLCVGEGRECARAEWAEGRSLEGVDIWEG
jgi:hypothetical protein